MALGGFNCPYCRYYNANGTQICGRCERWQPPEPLRSMLQSALATELFATKFLFAMNAAMFALQALDGMKSNGQVAIFTAFMGSNLMRFGALVFPAPESGVLYTCARVLTSCFVHMSVLHIGMNMLALADLGNLGEPLVKAPRFIAAYFITGIAGFAVSAAYYAHSSVVTAGASGAIFGLDGVLIAHMAIGKDRRWKQMLVRTILQSFAFYFVLHTNQAAHLGGLAAGLLLGVYFAKEKQPYRRDGLFTSFALAALVLTLVAEMLVQRSAAWTVEREAEHQHDMDDRLPPQHSEQR
jgi:rhomboid protease GluP